MSSVTLETFGESFLPLKNSFKFFQILGIYSIKWSERIWKNFLGAKTNHQMFQK